MQLTRIVLVSLPLTLLGCASDRTSDTPKSSTTAEPGAIIGNPPPAIRVAKWVKGEPIEKFEPGKVYVVDFWATWCGPCRAAIPHLTRLAEAHPGKVEIIGVSILEKQSGDSDLAYIDGVEKFVAKMGDRMKYRVAADTADKAMYLTWFKPSKMPGIPTAYIIDQRGNVAWFGIGDPKDVERIVGEVLAGTFDIKQEEAMRAKAEAEAEERAAKDIAAAKANNTNDKYPGYQAAMERGDQGAALAALDAAFKADPSSEASGAYQWKLMLLLQGKDPDAVTRYSRELLTKFRDNDDVVGFVSAVIVSTSDEAKFDTKVALEAAELTAARAKPDSRWQQFARWRLGWAYFHVNQREKAVEQVKDAMSAIERLKGTIDFDNLPDECREALDTFTRTPTK